MIFPDVVKTEYMIRVSTAMEKGAGTKAAVSVNIVGNQGETGPLPLRPTPEGATKKVGGVQTHSQNPFRDGRQERLNDVF